MKLDITATYSPEMKLKNKQTGNISTIILGQTGGTTVAEEKTLSEVTKDLVTPQKYSIGVGYGKNHKWFVGAEYTNIQNSKLNNSYIDLVNFKYEDTHRFSLGGYYTPKNNSFTSYFDRITYRLGARYENTGLKINNEGINDAAINFGVGIPVGVNRDVSNINIGLEYGKRGTKNNGLIQENYFNISIGLSFNDKWFQKRRYE